MMGLSLNQISKLAATVFADRLPVPKAEFKIRQNGL